MPVMAPLADVVGISRQTAVLAFQSAKDGSTHPADSRRHDGRSRVGGHFMEKWFRWMLRAGVFFHPGSYPVNTAGFCFITTSSLFFPTTP